MPVLPPKQVSAAARKKIYLYLKPPMWRLNATPKLEEETSKIIFFCLLSQK
jgi:hypothetical protein